MIKYGHEYGTVSHIAGHAKMSSKTAPGEINSLVKAIAILDSLDDEHPQMGVREVARRLNISTSTAGRMLSTLHRAGLLSQDPTTRLYRMGSKVLTWASVFTEGLDLRSKARPMLEELHRLTRETVNLYVLDGVERVCIDNIESPERVRVIVRVGEHMPLHAGSAGKAMLAFAPPSLIDQILANPLERMTSNTITDPKALLQELASIRKAGYAVSHGERFSDALGLAAPVFDASGNVTAALNVAGPRLRFENQVKKFAPKVVLFAHQISLALGCTN